MLHDKAPIKYVLLKQTIVHSFFCSFHPKYTLFCDPGNLFLPIRVKGKETLGQRLGFGVLERVEPLTFSMQTNVLMLAVYWDSGPKTRFFPGKRWQHCNLVALD